MEVLSESWQATEDEVVWEIRLEMNEDGHCFKVKSEEMNTQCNVLNNPGVES